MWTGIKRDSKLVTDLTRTLRTCDSTDLRPRESNTTLGGLQFENFKFEVCS